MSRYYSLPTSTPAYGLVMVAQMVLALGGKCLGLNVDESTLRYSTPDPIPADLVEKTGLIPLQN